MFIRSVTVACLFAFAALAQVPCKWEAEASQASPAQFSCYRGETLAFQPTFLEYGVTSTNATYTLHYQTNGMGTAYWSTNILQFTPAMDVGASSYTFFIRAATTNGVSYRANGKIKMLGAPGATPNTLPLPVQSINFATVSYLNAPWILSTELAALYPASNPSNYITIGQVPAETDTAAKALIASETNRAIQAEALLYPSSNPSNYIGIGQVPAEADTNALTQLAYYTNRIMTAWQNPVYTTKFQIEESTFGECKIVGYSNYVSTLTIPSHINGLAVTSLADGLFAGNQGIYTLKISGSGSAGSAGFSYLGSGTFAGCTNLQSVYSDNGISLGNDTFSGCTALRSFKASKFTASSRKRGFYGCISLDTVDLGVVGAINQDYFWGCSNLHAIYFSGSVPQVLFSGVYNGLASNQVTNFVSNTTATWPSTFEGMPVVRMPVASDLFTGSGAGLTNLVEIDTAAKALITIETNRAIQAETLLYPRNNPSNYIAVGQVPAAETDTAAKALITIETNRAIQAEALLYPRNNPSNLITLAAVRTMTHSNQLWSAVGTNATYQLSWDVTNGTFKVEEILP